MLMTPGGSGAIAVVRLAGEGVGEFLRRHFSRPAKEGRAVHGELSDAGRVIDDPVVAVGEGGRFADLSLHGGAWIVRSVLELAGREGFEVVGNGGKIPLDMMEGGSLLEREAMAALPLARTTLAMRVLLGQVEAWGKMDDAVGVEEVLRDRSLWWLLHPPRVAIVGAANVGKSTLANQLFAQERSITADVAGTTRDWVGEIANVEGLAVMLVDTPGMRETEDPIERVAIENSKGEIGRADLVVLVLDATRPVEGEQQALLDAFPGAMRVINKCDVGEMAGVEGMRVIAKRGEGVEELRRGILRYFGCEGMRVDQARWWTERQRRILRRGGGWGEVLAGVRGV